MTRTSVAGCWLLLAGMIGLPCAIAGDLVVWLSNDADVTMVGAIGRWDQDGNARRPVNTKAKIQSPRVDARATKKNNGMWIFKNLPAGRYDLVILAKGHIRIEGFEYPPVLEFDPFLQHGHVPDEETRKTIIEDIAQSRHYENKVKPLYMSGDDKTVRVLVQLLRDQKTSYDGQYGRPVATLRHEIWQYTNRYGAWTKEKRTRVLDRILMGRRELGYWTWVWVPELGGIEVPRTGKVTVRFAIPKTFSGQRYHGLFPGRQ